MKTPLENILDWLNALPVTYRQAVALEVAAMLPDMEPNFCNPFYHREFIAKITQPLPEKEGEAKRVATLKNLIAHIIAAKTKENEEWETMQASVKEMAEVTGSCSLAEQAFLQQSQYKQWTFIRETWETMAGKLPS